MRRFLSLLCICSFLLSSNVSTEDYNGLNMNLGNLSRLSKAKTRSISAENVNGEKGKGGLSTDGLAKDTARELGRDGKSRPMFLLNRDRHTLSPKLTVLAQSSTSG